ncbi:hypothetical protein [Mucilaginibacter sp.]|jgi:hypothetical protein|uniref:hypothetical protein n=1 Tax=Mucilaginibacter sp. TaxID=1882438 RepID=UPI002C5CD137|nr:hypothetical protein [Mucilaginibacter sp.]HTI61018.1 hypothetical protein [Mucilaginibacter sp.]
MVRHLFKGFLVLLLCFSVFAAQAALQDTVKKTAPQKSAAKPLAVKPVYRRPTLPKLSAAADSAQKAQMDPSQLNDKSLNGQYQYLLTKVYHYQQPLLAALWKNAMDTLKANKSQLRDAQAKLSSQGRSVDSLKTNLSGKEQSLSESNAKADAISVFGMLMPKSTYNLVMFGTVAVLAVALIIVIATTAKHKHEARYRTELYEEIDEEYKTFKAKAHEKELKLARELQTERNKLDELLGRG